MNGAAVTARVRPGTLVPGAACSASTSLPQPVTTTVKTVSIPAGPTDLPEPVTTSVQPLSPPASSTEDGCQGIKRKRSSMLSGPPDAADLAPRKKRRLRFPHYTSRLSEPFSTQPKFVPLTRPMCPLRCSRMSRRSSLAKALSTDAEMDSGPDVKAHTARLTSCRPHLQPGEDLFRRAAIFNSIARWKQGSSWDDFSQANDLPHVHEPALLSSSILDSIQLKSPEHSPQPPPSRKRSHASHDSDPQGHPKRLKPDFHAPHSPNTLSYTDPLHEHIRDEDYASFDRYGSIDMSDNDDNDDLVISGDWSDLRRQKPKHRKRRSLTLPKSPTDEQENAGGEDAQNPTQEADDHEEGEEEEEEEEDDVDDDEGEETEEETTENYSFNTFDDTPTGQTLVPQPDTHVHTPSPTVSTTGDISGSGRRSPAAYPVEPNAVRNALELMIAMERRTEGSFAASESSKAQVVAF